MPMRHHRIEILGAALIGILLAIGDARDAAQAQTTGTVQPWGLPPLPPGIGEVEKFADVSNTPQGQFLEGGAFDTKATCGSWRSAADGFHI